MSKWKSYIRDFLGRELIKDTIWTTIFSTIGKSVGFLIPFFIAAWFGVGKETDAFFFAYGLIIFLASIFSPVVEGIIVPFIAEARAKDGDIAAFVGRILGISAVGLCALSALFLLIIKPSLAVVTRFSPEGVSLIYTILLESVVLIVLIVWTSILAGSLNAYKVFSIPALSPAFRAIATLSFIFTFKDIFGVHAIAWGYVVGEVFRLSVLLLLLSRLNLFRIKLSIGWDKKFSEFFQTSSYQVIGMSILALTPMINKTMASWLGHGNVSILEYADRLYQIPMTLIGYGLFTVLLSHWSGDFYNSGEYVFRQKVIKVAKVVGAGTLLLSLILILLRQPLVNFVYKHGEFPIQYLNLVSSILGIYLIGLPPTIIGLIFVRAHLVLKNTKFLMVLGIMNFILNIVFNLVLIKPLGISGLALSTTVTYTILAVVLFFRKI